MKSSLLNYGQREVYINLNDKVNAERFIGRQIILPMSISKNDWIEVNWQAVKSHAFNGYYANSKKGKTGILKASTAYNRYKALASHLLKKGKLPMLKGDIVVLMTVVFGDRKVRDAQNYTQVVYDAMEDSGCLFENDTQIKFSSTLKEYIKGQNFILAYVFELNKVTNIAWTSTHEQLLDILEKNRESK